MGIGLSKLVSDNLSKGKQPIQNSLFNFVARAKTTQTHALVSAVVPCTTVLESTEESAASKVPSEYTDKEHVESFHIGAVKPIEENEEKKAERIQFELPSQIDAAVFNELPDDLKNDIIQDYQRKGITINEIVSTVRAEEPLKTFVAGPSLRVPDYGLQETGRVGTSRVDNPVSYDGIDQITDIDASYWSALPDDIKAEIERDIQQRKAESTSPKKEWENVLKGQRSPVKTVGKFGKRKTKAQETLKSKIQPTVKVPPLPQKVNIDSYKVVNKLIFIHINVERDS